MPESETVSSAEPARVEAPQTARTAASVDAAPASERATVTPGKEDEASARPRKRAWSWLDRALGRVKEEPEQEKEVVEQQRDEKPVPSLDEIEAEINRRVELRLAEERRKAEEERLRELRRKDPVAYAEEQEKRELVEQHYQALSNALKETVTLYDRNILDPIVEALPKEARDALLKTKRAGIDGRKALVRDALKELEKHWKDQGAKEAEARLRKSKSFRKELLAELRDQGAAEEPDHVEGAAPHDEVDMNAWMRAQLGRLTGRRF